jgi:predicted TIM-barrel fold metal-dependent hydrolase
MIIDTHLHLVDRTRLSYPWLSSAPALDRDWTIEDYETTARRIGITAALHMEVDVAASDIDRETAWIRDLMQRPGSLIRGCISAARPESAEFPAWLDRLDRSVVRGIRRVLHVVPDEVSQSATFRDGVRRLGAAGLPFDICMLARQLPLAADLIDSAPDTTFILDHCGVPDIAGQDFSSWSTIVRNLAQRPNLNAKISGITAYTGGSWTQETLRPYFHHIIDCFGWSRVVWGSDSPVCTLHSSLSEWVATSQALVADASNEERAALFHANATRIWKL